MPTATDALQAAADELHAATLAMYGVRDEVRAGIAQTKGAATTVITNFLRGSVKNWFFDAIAGVDTNDGLDVTRPKRTLDALLDAIEADGTSVFGNVVFMLTDGVIRYHHSLSSPITIIGAEWGGGAFGGLYHTVLRNLSFQTEVAGVGRTTPCVRTLGSSMRLVSLAIAMPDVPATFNQTSLFVMINGGTVSIDGITLTCATSTSAVSLLGVAAPTVVSFQGTLGTNAAGHVFLAIPAGTNPNANFAYRTNLMTA
jgi:hypothetical protein